MPFRSEKQRRYMYAKHPEIAKSWTEKYGSDIQPKKKKKKRRKEAALRRLMGQKG